MAREKTLDMTKGSPLNHIVRFSIPLIIGNIFQQFYSMADTIIVGRTISVEALAAVGASASLIFFIIGFAQGLTGGFAIIVSQKFGANDPDGVRRSVAMGAMLSAAFSVLLTAASAFWANDLLVWLNTPKDILADAHSYLFIIFLGIPANMFYNYMSAVIRALGDSKTPLYFLLVASALNVILDFVFILYGHMGVAGAAIATNLSQVLSGLLCLIYANRRLPNLHLSRKDWRFNRRFAWHHLRMGVPMGIHTSVIAMGSMAVQSAVNGFGACAVAGQAAALRVEQLVTQIMTSLGMTLATYVAQNFGAERLDRIKNGVKTSAFLIVGFSIVGAALVIVFGEGLTRIFVDAADPNADEVVAMARLHINVVACFYPVLSGIFVFRSTLQGIGKTVVVLIGSALELIARMVGAFLLADAFGYIGACFSSPLAWSCATVMLFVIYIIDIRALSRRMGASEQKK